MNDLVLLAALLGGPAYGYALKKTAGFIFGSGALHNNVIYPSLKKFVHKGWVAQKAVPGERGQQRKQYRLTASGKKFLFEEIAKFTDRDAAHEGAFLFRLAFFDSIPPEARTLIIGARKAFLTARLAEFLQLLEQAPAGSFPKMALDRIMSRAEDELGWIDQIERSIGAKSGRKPAADG